MKHIAYTAKLIDGNGCTEVEVRIRRQTDRGHSFSDNRRLKWGTRCFYYKGLYLLATDYPFYQTIKWSKTLNNVVFVRGNTVRRDDDRMILPLATYTKFKAAVLAYNEKFK